MEQKRRALLRAACKVVLAMFGRRTGRTAVLLPRIHAGDATARIANAGNEGLAVPPMASPRVNTWLLT